MVVQHTSSHTSLPNKADFERLLGKYNTRGPRYTSYPTVPSWHEGFGGNDFESAVFASNQPEAAVAPLALYIHLPFCEKRCLYCSCNVVISQQHEIAEAYLSYLFQEMERVAALLLPHRPIVQYHWGGGTPTYLSEAQITRLFRKTQQLFSFSDTAEIAIEIDPRVTTYAQLMVLRQLGFNRVSLGVQDFDAVVQKAIGRIQSVQLTEDMVEDCRVLGFQSVNFDLIYGLPYQTTHSFDKTLDEVIRLNPDRIALYNYAHVPWISPHQKDIPEAALPDAAEKLAIFTLAMEKLLGAGYVYIGMDHFAKPNDELTQALTEGRLSRNFMGYTVLPDSTLQPDLYGFGCSAISSVGSCYAQNHKKLSTYYAAIENRESPTLRGYQLHAEDKLRRHVINNILCQGELDLSSISQQYSIDATSYFASELQQLEEAFSDGLIMKTAHGFEVTQLGRIFSRNLAMPFDAYLSQQSQQSKNPVFSKTV